MDSIINKLEQALNKGQLLEVVLELVLIDLGYIKVKRQKSGAQYGYDLVATRQSVKNEVWKFECKNLSNSISINDIAPKLVWHLGQEIIDRFVIVSVSEPSNYLNELLATVKFPFPIELWSREYLVQQILKSSQALKYLGIEMPVTVQDGLSPIVYEQTLISFGAFYSEQLPYCYDYFMNEKKMIKAYTEQSFNVTAVFCNNSKSFPFICTEINVITLSYAKVEGRIFRQSKMKGIIEPEKFIFIPSTIPMRSVSILKPGQLFEVKINKDDYFAFELDDKQATDGYYEIIFEAKGKLDGREMIMYSSVFPLHITDSKADLINLYTVGKFYDTPADDILNISNEKWDQMKKIGKDAMPFLGSTIINASEGANDATWKVRMLEGTPADDDPQSMDVDPSKPSDIYLDLEIPIREKLYSYQDVFDKMLGTNWQDKI
ncbi:MAG: hypothetical protein JWO44_191 [Bacteroidetes bacterium]|nr:hypothetical protein [Bacteroidota bacterium]